MGTNQHVVPFMGNWAVRAEGRDEITSTHRLQSEAIMEARKIAKEEKSELFIHGRNGKIRARDSYGNDPRGSKG